MEAAFWLLVGLAAVIYGGYPLFAVAAAGVLRRSVRRAEIEPSVSIVIAAFDEAAQIAETVRNKLSLDYPEERLEVIVVSDASDDGTDEAVAALGEPRVRLIRQEPRQGKTAALNRGVAAAKGEIVVFSDANSIYETDALRELVRNFADPEVGYVTGQMRYRTEGRTPTESGCGAYMRYENFLRSRESLIGSVVGVDGGIDAVRRRLYRRMRPDQLPDLVLPLAVVDQGYRVVYEPRAVLVEPALRSGTAEMRMRVRVSLRALWAIWDMRRLLSVRRCGVFAFQLLAHKVARYLAFAVIVPLYPLNAWLATRSTGYAVLFALQTLWYGAALASIPMERAGWTVRALYLPYYFSLVNLAAMVACLRFLRGEKQVLWTPRVG